MPNVKGEISLKETNKKQEDKRISDEQIEKAKGGKGDEKTSTGKKDRDFAVPIGHLGYFVPKRNK